MKVNSSTTAQSKDKVPTNRSIGNTKQYAYRQVLETHPYCVQESIAFTSTDSDDFSQNILARPRFNGTSSMSHRFTIWPSEIRSDTIRTMVQCVVVLGAFPRTLETLPISGTLLEYEMRADNHCGVLKSFDAFADGISDNGTEQ